MGRESAKRRNRSRREPEKKAAHPPPTAGSDTEEPDAPLGAAESVARNVESDTSETSALSEGAPAPRRPRKIARSEIDGLRQKDARDAR